MEKKGTWAHAVVARGPHSGALLGQHAHSEEHSTHTQHPQQHTRVRGCGCTGSSTGEAASPAELGGAPPLAGVPSTSMGEGPPSVEGSAFTAEAGWPSDLPCGQCTCSKRMRWVFMGARTCASGAAFTRVNTWSNTTATGEQVARSQHKKQPTQSTTPHSIRRQPPDNMYHTYLCRRGRRRHRLLHRQRPCWRHRRRPGCHALLPEQLAAVHQLHGGG